MITTNQALYDVVRRLAEALRQAGEPKLATDLLQALSISSLPGEILGETRIHLERVKTTRAFEQISIRRNVGEAIGYINRVLGG